jgi:nitrogenase subunit NifH
MNVSSLIWPECGHSVVPVTLAVVCDACALPVHGDGESKILTISDQRVDALYPAGRVVFAVHRGKQ